jgi:hypothetical protein
MGLLSKPSKSASYQSWQDVDGLGNVLVQRRTGDGLGKNRSAAHRIAYSATDLFPFRIILLEGSIAGLGYNASSIGATKDHEGNQRMKDAIKYVIAAGQSKAEILKDWNDIRDFTDAGALTSKAWPDTYKHVQYQKRHNVGPDGGSVVTSTVNTPAPSPARRLDGVVVAVDPASPSPLAARSDSGSIYRDASSPALRETTSRDVSATSPLTPSPSSPIHARGGFSLGTEKYREAAESPLEAADGNDDGVASPVDETVYALPVTEQEVRVPPVASVPEKWLMRVGRLWDGTAPIASLLVAAILLVFTAHGSGSVILGLIVPAFVGSLLPLDPATRKSDERAGRLAYALRCSPLVRALAQRQLVANRVAMLVMTDFVLGVFVGNVARTIASNAACGAIAASIFVSAGSVFFGENRESWHTRLAAQETRAIHASREARDSAELPASASPSSDNAGAVASVTGPVSPAASTMRVPTTITAPQSSFSTSTAHSGAALGPCLDPIPLADIPPAVRHALELVAGKAGAKWHTPTVMNGVTVQTGIVPWTHMPASKLHIVMPGLRAMSMYRVLYDDPTGAKGRKSYIFQIEDMLADRYLIRRNSANDSIWYTAFNSRYFGIAGRDFANRVHPFTILTPEIRKEYGLTDAPGFVYAAESFEGEGTPAPNPPYVRGKMYRYGVVVQDLPNDQGVEFTSVVSINPNGHIPAMTVPLVNRDTSKRLRNLESFARNLERNSNPRPEAIRDPPAPVAAEKPKTERPKTQAALEERTREPAVSEPSSIADGIPVQHTPVQVDKALTLMNETGWQDKGEKEGCTWEAKAVPYSTAEAGRFRIFMAGVHAANLAEMLDDDPELTKGKQSTERHICGLALKKLVSHGPDAGEPLATCVDYKTRRLFPTVHPRDFPARVVGRYFLNEAEKAEYRVGHPGCDVFVTAAIHDPDIPQAKKYVRGTMHVFGIVASDRPDGTGCDVVQVVANELGGSLPVSVVNGVAGGQMDKLNKMHALFRSLEAKAGRLPSPGPTRPYAAGNVPDTTPTGDPNAAAQDDRDAADPAAPTTRPAPTNGRQLNIRDGPLPEPFAKAIRLWREPAWKEAASREGAVQRTQPSPFCPKDALWMQVFCAGATIEDVDVALNDDEETYQPKDAPYKYDQLLDSKEVHEVNEAERTMVLHTMFKTPTRIVAPRDTVTLLYWREALSSEHLKQLDGLAHSETGRAFAAAAVEEPPEKIPPKKGFVRGCTHSFSLWGIEQQNGVDLHIVMSFDTQGSVPATFINRANAVQLEKIILMRQLIVAAAKERTRRP